MAGPLLLYSIIFKIEVVNYAEKHGNRAAERRFGSPRCYKNGGSKGNI